MFIESISKFTFNETVAKITEAIEANSWRVLGIHNLHEILKNKGIDVLSVSVIELCNSKYSARLLKSDDHRIYSNLMPCRISVYEKNDGKVYISRMNAPAFASQIGGLVQEVMANAFDDSEKILALSGVLNDQK